MIYAVLAIIFALLIVSGVLFFQWRKQVKSGDALAGVALSLSEEKKAATADRDWYRDENLRLQGSVDRLSRIVFDRRFYERMLESSLDEICALCNADKRANDATGIPDICVTCEAYSRRKKFEAMKGAHTDGTDTAE